MTKRELTKHLDRIMAFVNEAYECAEEGNPAGAYTAMVCARDSLTKGIRQYNDERDKEQAA